MERLGHHTYPLGLKEHRLSRFLVICKVRSLATSGNRMRVPIHILVGAAFLTHHFYYVKWKLILRLRL